MSHQRRQDRRHCPRHHRMNSRLISRPARDLVESRDREVQHGGGSVGRRRLWAHPVTNSHHTQLMTSHVNHRHNRLFIHCPLVGIRLSVRAVSP